ncbi:M28 family peptidase [Pseudoalteromonas citrea]|uniref:M28 family peptidase n=1 Tax=Pseudoalteromonas citrea TaxID=43655 RepID=UPI0020166644|nr:M28 family peptidase [Pseudoalteromonas citrea]
MIKNGIKASYAGYKQWLKISILSFVILSEGVLASQLQKDMQMLTSKAHAGRKAGGSEGPNVSAQYIHQRFEQLEYQPFYQSFEFKTGFFSTAKGHNVIATLPCTVAPCEANIVITAHYDHLGGQPSSYYAGANDNASGTSTLLLLAQSLKQVNRRHTVTFVATDAEEKGLYGAKHFVNELEVNKQTILNINLDMLAPNKRNRLYVLHSKQTKFAVELLKKQPSESLRVKIVNSRYKMQRLMDNPRIDWHKASDHYAFAKENIPYLYFGIGEDKNHHTKRDTLESLDFSRFQLVVNFINNFMVGLLDTPLEATN